MVGYVPAPVFADARSGDVRNSEADLSVARERLGYAPLVSFSDGIRRTVAWYIEQAAGRAVLSSPGTGA